jgi:decaprenyl-phosphate phosphoribosyltransferase
MDSIGRLLDRRVALRRQMLQTAGVSGPTVQSSRSFARALVSTARPRQWVKNALVVAAAGAAGALGHDDVPGRVSAACVAFCLLASGIYAVNDVRDVAEDRLHPRKRLRPVAAGDLAPWAAITAGAAAIAVGLAACLLISPLLGLVALGYIAMTLSYTLVWRHLVVFDVVAVAGGFVLRAIAGGVAADVHLSGWFIAVVTLAAVLVATGKRRAELLRAQRGQAPRRRVLAHYTDAALLTLLILSAIGTLIAYYLWALEAKVGAGIPWRVLTVVPFTAAAIRYVAMVRGGDGEAPEEMLFGDRALQIASAAWLALFVLEVNAAG